ncbi:MAG: NAD(P)-dependent alcohol dehydrogenase [Pseudomonadota bacterium]
MKKRYKLGFGFLGLLAGAFAVLLVAISRNSDCPADIPSSDSPDAMTAVVQHCYGGPEVLTLTREDRPTVGEKEVLIRIVAAGVNPLDWHFMRGTPYVMRLMSGIGKPGDQRVGVDFAGTVEAIGPGVTRFKQGDRVFGGANGAFGEYVVRSEDRAIAIIPENISFEQAAGVGIAGVTALQALTDKGKLQRGEKVLINGASGGVGTFAVQIAKAMGAEVTGICSGRNRELVLGLGADYVIDYKVENFTEQDKQYDLIVDNVGNHSLSRLRGVLVPTGRLVIVGGKKGDWIAPLVPTIKTMIVGPFVDQEIQTLLAVLTQESVEKLAAMMGAGEVTPVIDQRFDLADVRNAIAYSESGRARGKIILEIDPESL